ncbi:hypothetical protein [Pseudochrobactrum lubricantis]|uniref:hypothetical protein n=1 Tax=Pseudochrobactrum lubricantis TaxID=558172 RepID=UPI0035D8520A
MNIKISLNLCPVAAAPVSGELNPAPVAFMAGTAPIEAVVSSPELFLRALR